MKNFIIIIGLIFLSNAAFAKSYNIKWREKNGKITLNTVCFNYKDRLNLAGCKNQAKTYFYNKCKQTKSKKFCKASKNFKPDLHGNFRLN